MKELQGRRTSPRSELSPKRRDSMKALTLVPVSSTDITGLNGVPRRRPPAPPPESKHGIQALRELRQVTPPVSLIPGTESAFLERGGLTQFKCLRWLDVAKQLYDSPASFSDSAPLRKLPPIAFLKLLIEWIEDYARATGRQRNKGPTWRWRALQGFVHNSRRLQTRKFLINVMRLARSIAAHFLNAPFDSQLLVLWGDWHRWRSSASTPADPIAHRPLADRVFTVLGQFRNGSKVSTGDYETLEPFLSKRFRRPFVIDALYSSRERQSLSEFIAYAAVTDVYLQHRDLMDKTTLFQHYIEEATHWALRLGEPSLLSEFEVICWRFCAHSAVKFKRRQKKRTPFFENQ